MEIISAREKLKSSNLDHPILNALQATETLYTTLAYQPSGHILIQDDFIGNADEKARVRARSFLNLINELDVQPDLVISPEYSIPWQALSELLLSGSRPDAGKLWILGCESLKLGELANIRDNLRDIAVVLDDDTSPVETTTQRYRNPVVYIFETKSLVDESLKLVLLVQYKTCPSGDKDNTEAKGMLPGKFVYVFGDYPQEVRLITLICSDVFEFKKSQIDAYYDGLLLVHIQLNNNPRHPVYKKYRLELFQAAGKTELICLNWAEHINAVINDKVIPWGNIGGSAWYLQSPEVDLKEVSLKSNHEHGIYYTYNAHIHAHSFIFDYKPRAFLFQSTKVHHHALAKPLSTRTGPKAIKTFIWQDQSAKWVEPKAKHDWPNDGFTDRLSVIKSEGVDLDDLQTVYQACPVSAERVLAISAGGFGIRQDWFAPNKIDSMQLSEQEFVHRMTVLQDTAKDVTSFRSARFSSIRAIAELRSEDYTWPSAVSALNQGFNFNWSSTNPNRNVVAKDGTFATVVHLGMISDLVNIKLYDSQIRKALAGPPPEPERLLSANEYKMFEKSHYDNSSPPRYCILYVDSKGTQNYINTDGVSYIKPAGYSPVDISQPSRMTQNDSLGGKTE
ncbi:hypothetical protein INP77_00445 [Methylophilus sp. 13]|uniref:hypothetical protein n=1 Tax=Methylophilus sp. 13 TaxID=2781018 RepID=UPI00188F5EA5|nr:hypothetical protein [Methylophilus sp. 13]MBF5037950.1 hypothetical protein [Methylophilus sp. 13]